MKVKIVKVAKNRNLGRLDIALNLVLENYQDLLYDLLITGVGERSEQGTEPP